MTTAKANLFDYDRKGLRDLFAQLGEKPYRADQVMKWVYHRHVTDFAQMTDVGKALRDKLSDAIEITPPNTLLEKQASDGTHKWLLGMDGRNAIEAVFIPETSRGTLCVSSQIGCGLNCQFCSTGTQGFNRNLSAAEIIGQVWVAAKHLGNVPHHQRKLTNVVMMGMTRSRDALVHDLPGVTRDRHYGVCRIAATPFVVVDTGGFIENAEGLDSQTARQAEFAIDEADVVLLTVDARDGLLPTDRAILDRLRRSGKPMLLVVNKVDGLDENTVLAEFSVLGVADVFPTSAAHSRGLAPLLATVQSLLPAMEADPLAESADDGIRVAIVGRPNVGKSTLVNRLLGEERVIASDVPGTTRDSIRIALERDGKRYTLIDTAGIRRRARVEDALEKFSVIKSLQSVEAAHVTVLMQARRFPVVRLRPARDDRRSGAGRADRPPQCRPRGARDPAAVAAAGGNRSDATDRPHRCAQGCRRLPGRERRSARVAPARPAPVHAERRDDIVVAHRSSRARPQGSGGRRVQPRRPSADPRVAARRLYHDGLPQVHDRSRARGARSRYRRRRGRQAGAGPWRVDQARRGRHRCRHQPARGWPPGRRRGIRARRATRVVDHARARRRRSDDGCNADGEYAGSRCHLFRLSRANTAPKNPR